MSGLYSVIYFLVSVSFAFVLFILWSRILVRLNRISVLTPVSQMIYHFTNPLVKPFSNLINPQKVKSIHYDWACLATIIVVEFIKFILISLLLYGALMPMGYLLLFVFADLIMQPCNLLFYLILARVIMSWVNPSWQDITPLGNIVKKITEPLLDFGRYLTPNISGFDFSPLVILVILKAITIFMSASLPARLL